MAGSIQCYGCKQDGQDVMFCTGCNINLCDSCYNIQLAHHKPREGPDEVPHERVDSKIADGLARCMAEPKDENEQYTLHQIDEDTTWFGLERDPGGEPVLAEYRRYASIMSRSSAELDGTRYPALVSFIGRTGAGKSSLIKLLIDLKSEAKSSDESNFLSAPVIGRSSTGRPASADVHLYMSPDLALSHRPILYGDSEGLEGGESDPVATSAVAAGDMPGDVSSIPSGTNSFRNLARSLKRSIKWASRDTKNNENTSKRGFAVSEMYPRILYAFSDVIVYVLDNHNTLEVVVEKLLHWADANYSATINQPSKPHAIIALNKSPDTLDEYQWNPVHAKAELLENADISKNNTFVKYAEKWKDSRFEIRNMEDLLKCYYSTIHVVRFPLKTRYSLLETQRKHLHAKIQECCEISYETKLRYQLLPDVDELSLYLSLAFDHFSETLEEPFNFVEASLRFRPSSENLADNILDVALRFALTTNQEGQIRTVFSHLTRFIASSILLESVRKQRIGRPEDWFSRALTLEEQSNKRNQSQSYKKARANTYRDMCKDAIREYFNFHTPCQFQFKPDKSCQTRRMGHISQGHKRKAAFGIDQAYGEFEHNFDIDGFAWENRVLSNIKQQQEKCKQADFDDYKAAVFRNHVENVIPFYKQATLQFRLNSACVCCLANPPNCHLACGHIICLECARDFGRPEGATRLVIERCPLHEEDSIHRQSSRTVIPLEPPFSGLRVLVLDGGGVRGIIELCVLRALEDRLGISLQKFFDLVVGTSTGGIIALAFGHSLWPVSKCIGAFKELVDPAFTLRRGQNVPLIRRIQVFVKHSRYETKQLESSLRTAFTSDDLLFRKLDSAALSPLKTAVTATSSAGRDAWLLANYHSGPNLEYRNYRPRQPKNELKTWEAARATSAAPGFFKPFKIMRDDSRIMPDLIDGGVLHNNPVSIAVEEVRRISRFYRQVSTPDVVVSIGTGLQGKYNSEKEHLNSTSSSPPGPSHHPPWLRDMYTLLKYQVELNLDTDRRWQQAVERACSQNPLARYRMKRINLDLKRAPPNMSDKAQVQILENEAVGILEADPMAKRLITETVCILVASSFYFEKYGTPNYQSNSSAEVSGYIRCRLGDSGDDVQNLGRFLQQCQGGVASFLIYNTPRQPDDEDQKVNVSLNEMVRDKKYLANMVRILITGDDVETAIALKIPGISDGHTTFYISGFPRPLLKHDFGPR